MNQEVQTKLQDGKFEFWFCRPRKTNGKRQTPEPWMPPELITLKGDKYIVSLHQYPILIVIYILCMLQHLHATLPLIPPLLQLLWVSGPSPNFSLTCNFCLLQLKCEQHYHYNKFRPIIISSDCFEVLFQIKEINIMQPFLRGGWISAIHPKPPQYLELKNFLQPQPLSSQSMPKTNSKTRHHQWCSTGCKRKA